VTPVGLSRGGLPMGVQVIGDNLHDLTTIEVARLIAAEVGGFAAPPGY